MSISRKDLYKKKHGLLGMCIPGEQGIPGTNGNGIHIGFINDFFESFDISVNTVVKIAKRKDTSNNINNNYKAWVNKQLSTFRASNNSNNNLNVYDTHNISEEVFGNILNDSSANVYYTGRVDEENYLGTEYQIDNQIGNANIVDGIYTKDSNNSSIFASNDPHNNVMLDSWEFHQIYDINYKGKDNYDLYEYTTDDITHAHHIKYDVKISYDTTTFEPEDIAKTLGYESFQYPEKIYNSGWGTYYTFLTTNGGNTLIKSSTNSDQMNAAYEKPIFDNKAKGVLSHIAIITPDKKTQQTTYNGNGVPQLTYMTKYAGGASNNTDIMSQYIHTTVDMYPNYIKDAVIDANGFTQIGVDLYNNDIANSANVFIANKPLSETLNIKKVKGGLFYEFPEKHKNTIKKLEHNIEVTINKLDSNLNKRDSSVKWYVDPYKNIKIPTTLRKDITDGDILYFYTDAVQFNKTGELPYMVEVTPELRKCDINTLLKYTVPNPLQYRSIYTNSNNKNIQLYNNVTIMYAGNSYQNIQNRTNIRSLNNILTYNNKSLLHLPAVKDQFGNYNFIEYKSFEKLNKINNRNNSNINSLCIKASTDDTSNNINYIIGATGATVQCSDLYVHNKTFGNIIPEGVFDDNIVTDKDLYNSLCLKPITLDNFQIIPQVKKNERYDILKITLDKTKYVIKNIDNYYLGCIIVDEKGNVIYQDETLDNNSVIIPDFKTQITDSSVNELTCNYQLLLYIRHANKFKRFAKACQISYTLKCNTVGYTNIENLVINTLDENFYAIQNSENNITNNSDITIDITGITCEQINNHSLKIKSNNQNLIIDKIYFNNAPVITTYEEVYNMLYDNTSIGNTWFTVNMDKQELLPFHLKQYTTDTENRYATYEYTLDIADNIPNIISLNGNTTVHTVNINDYMSSLSDEVSEQRFVMVEYSNITGRPQNSIIECDLFRTLQNKHSITATAPRDIKLNMLYHIADISNNVVNNKVQYKTLSTQYTITQPGFTDPRTLPVFKFETYNSPDIVEKINKDVESNAYVHLTKLTVENFGYDNWGKFIKNKEDVKISFTIKNLDYDIEWKEKLQIENAHKRATLKFIPEDKTHNGEPNSIKFITNVIKCKDFDLGNSRQFNPNPEITQTFDILNNYINQKDVTDNSNKNMLLLWDKNIFNVCKNPEEIHSGIYANITINFKDLTINDLKDGLFIYNKVIMSNPIIGNMYLRYYIDNFTITYKDSINGKSYHFTSSVNQSVDTYLHNTEGNKDNYRFISDKIDVMFNPISYVICPEDEETNILPIRGNIKKESSDALITRKLSLFMPTIYDSNILNIPVEKQRQLQLLSWDGLLLKKSSFEDNIQNINIKYIPNTSNKPTIKVVYNSVIMNPKIRDNKNTFYYNDEEYEADRYNQYKLNRFIPVTYETSWKIRTDSMMDAIDVWNYEYQSDKDAYKSSIITPFNGVLNKYGNAYMYLSDNYDTNQYGNKILSLHEVKQDGNILLHKLKNVESLDFSEPKNENYPESTGYKRSFLWNIGLMDATTVSTIINPTIPQSIYNFMGLYSRIGDGYLNDYYDSIRNKYYIPEKYGEDNYNNAVYDFLKLTPRIAYNSETNNINVLMLRTPCIGKDVLNLQDALYNCTLKKRYFDLGDDTIDYDECFYNNPNKLHYKDL